MAKSQRQPRARAPRKFGRQAMPDAGRQLYIIHPDDIPAEDTHLVLVGSKRTCSSYLNNGEVIVHGQVVPVTGPMANVLLRRTWIDPESNEEKPMWMLATDEEIEAFEAGGSLDDDGSQASAQAAKEARESAVNAGHANYETEQQHAERDAVESTRKPRKRSRKANEE